MYNNKITLILMTCGRPNMIYLNIRRMKNFPCSILIMDGSAQPINANFFPQHISYQHVPDSNFLVRMKKGVDQVKTPYVALVAERRMVPWSSYANAITFLHDNPEYSCVHGKIVYMAGLNEARPLYVFTYGLNGYNQNSALQRLLANCEKYQPLFYGVTRTEIFKSITVPSIFESFVEYYIQYKLLIHGKVAILPHLYECILPSPPRPTNYRYKTHTVLPLLLPTLQRLLIPEFSQAMNCTEEKANSLLQEIIFFDIRSKFKAQEIIRKQEKSISLEDFLATCDDNAPQVMLNTLNFCTENFDLYEKALMTSSPFAPSSTKVQEQELYHRLQLSSDTSAYQQAWDEAEAELHLHELQRHP